MTGTDLNGKLVYAVDDEEPIREVYKYAIESAGMNVQCFSCAAELFSETEKRVPDLFILDIMLDGLDGYEILTELKKNPATTDVPVIMVSAKTAETDKVKGLNLGADDYLVKPFGVLELIARINAKFRAAAPKKTLLKYKDIELDASKREITVKGEKLPLTLKQYELLKTLMEHADAVAERDYLLDTVWGENYGETRTLDIHVGELRKLLRPSDAEIITVRGVGYTLK